MKIFYALVEVNGQSSILTIREVDVVVPDIILPDRVRLCNPDESLEPEIEHGLSPLHILPSASTTTNPVATHIDLGDLVLVDNHFTYPL